MYKYTITYANSKGETVSLGEETGVWLDENDLFDWSWEYVTTQSKLVATSRPIEEKSVKLLYLDGDDPTQIERFLEVFDYDARMVEPGTLTVNGYQRRGVFLAASTDDYMWKPGLMRRDMTFLAVDPDWSRRHVYTFDIQQDVSEAQMVYPHGYPHDYGAAAVPGTFVNQSAFPSEFLLRIYGPCSNPYLVIGGNLYSVSATVADGGFLVIDSTDKGAVYNYGPTGAAVNVFDAAKVGAKGGGSYLFEQIQPGTNQVSSPNSFKFDVEIVEGISVPPAWEV